MGAVTTVHLRSRGKDRWPSAHRIPRADCPSPSWLAIFSYKGISQMGKMMTISSQHVLTFTCPLLEALEELSGLAESFHPNHQAAFLAFVAFPKLVLWGILFPTRLTGTPRHNIPTKIWARLC